MNAQTLINPYKTTNYVVGDDFFNRDEEITEILTTLEAEDNVIIIEGQRRIGKTSLLRQLEKNILTRSPLKKNGVTQTPSYFPMFLDMQTYPSQISSLENFQYAIVKDIARYLDISLPDKDLFDFDRQMNSILNTLKEKQLIGVILFDEFDLLSGYPPAITHYLNWLNEVFIGTRSKNLKWILSCGQKLSRLAPSYDLIVSKRKPIRLSLFNKKLTEEILRSPELLDFDPDAISEIYSLTTGHPLLVQAFGSGLFHDIYLEDDRKNIKLSDVQNIVPKILNDRTSAIVSIVRCPPVEKNLLLAVSTLKQDKGIANYRNIANVVGEQNIRIQIEEIDRGLNHLINWEILKGDSQSLNFVVPVIQRWIYENWSFVSKEDIEEFIDFNEELAENRYQMGKKAEERQKNEEAKINYKQATEYSHNHIASWEGLLRLEENILERIQITQMLYSLNPKKYKNILKGIRQKYANQLEQNADLIGAAKQFCEMENVADFWDKEVQRLALRILSNVLLHLQSPRFGLNKDLIQRDLNDLRELINLSEKVNFLGDDLDELYNTRNKLLEMLSKPEEKKDDSSPSILLDYTDSFLQSIQPYFRLLIYLFLFGLSAILIITQSVFGIILLLMSLWLAFFLNTYSQLRKKP